MPKKIECEQELDETFQSFLKSLKPHSANAYGSVLRYWLNFSHLNGKELLEFKRNDKDAATEKKVMAFKQYMMGLGKSENFANVGVSAIRGFFTENRMPLVFTRRENERLQESSRKTEDYLFSQADMRKMGEASETLAEKYVVLVGKSFGLRRGDFSGLTYGKFRSLHLDEETPIGIGETKTEKESVPAWPFLDSDAVPIVKTWLERNTDKNDKDCILDLDEQSLNLTLQRVFKRAGLVSGCKRVRFHCLRKYLIDRLSAVASESQWKQIVGKSISEGAYVSQDQLREVYARAMPSIIVNGNNKNHAKLEEMETELAEMKRLLADEHRKLTALEQSDMERSKQIGDLKAQVDKLSPEEIKKRVVALRQRRRKHE